MPERRFSLSERASDLAHPGGAAAAQPDLGEVVERQGRLRGPSQPASRRAAWRKARSAPARSPTAGAGEPEVVPQPRGLAPGQPPAAGADGAGGGSPPRRRARPRLPAARRARSWCQRQARSGVVEAPPGGRQEALQGGDVPPVPGGARRGQPGEQGGAAGSPAVSSRRPPDPEAGAPRLAVAGVDPGGDLRQLGHLGRRQRRLLEAPAGRRAPRPAARARAGSGRPARAPRRGRARPAPPGPPRNGRARPGPPPAPPAPRPSPAAGAPRRPPPPASAPPPPAPAASPPPPPFPQRPRPRARPSSSRASRRHRRRASSRARKERGPAIQGRMPPSARTISPASACRAGARSGRSQRKGAASRIARHRLVRPQRRRGLPPEVESARGRRRRASPAAGDRPVAEQPGR